MVASVRRALRRAKSLSSHWVIWARNTAVKVVLLTVLTTFQLWLAFFMYGTFYYAYMPTELHTKPVYFDFGLCDRFDGSVACPFPQTNISLVNHPVQERLFMPGQRYHMLLDMDMPQSPVNEDLGVFMVKIETFSKSDEITSKSSRPAMIRYRSPFLKMINVVCLAPFYLTGYAEEKQNLQVSLMDDFIDNAYKPTIKIGLEVRAKKIELYAVVLKVHAQFTGLRYLMFYWPVSSALVSVIANFCFLTVLSMMMWQQCVGFLIDEPSLEEREVPNTSVLTYEERRRMARQNMGEERSALFRNRPAHVTIIDPLDPQAQISPSPSISQPGTSARPSSPGKSPQRNIRKRSSRTPGDLTEGNAQLEAPSSGISSDESNQKGGEQNVETLKGDDSLSGYSDATTSSTSEDPPPGLDDDKEEVYCSKEGCEEQEDKDEVTDVKENVAGPQPTSGILRKRSYKSS
ncbi:seipin-like [Lytechinus pictus]|uniref:seipin-like n=1 Tax=Lytechinus pictus TaxID=7653 RepID=UPI0030B9EBA5